MRFQTDCTSQESGNELPVKSNSFFFGHLDQFEINFQSDIGIKGSIIDLLETERSAPPGVYMDFKNGVNVAEKILSFKGTFDFDMAL